MSQQTPHPLISQAQVAARDLWDSGKPADPHHPALDARGIGAHHLRQSGGSLLVPLMRDPELTPTNDEDPLGNVLLVSVSGRESTAGVEVRSRSPEQPTRTTYPRTPNVAAVFGQAQAPAFGRLDGQEVEYMGGVMAGASRVYLCTGWGAAAKVHEATGCPAVGALRADELVKLAESMRRNLPVEVAIVVAATARDIERARDAAGAINARLVRADTELGVA